MEASSIITQVSREDEHLKSFVPDKGKSISPGRASIVFGMPTYTTLLLLLLSLSSLEISHYYWSGCLPCERDKQKITVSVFRNIYTLLIVLHINYSCFVLYYIIKNCTTIFLLFSDNVVC